VSGRVRVWSTLRRRRLQTVDPCDGRPLLARYDLAAAARTLTLDTLAARRSGGLWRWAEILPVHCATNVVFLGEGGTPLVPVPRLGQALGAPRLALKAEGCNPTGSFKARGMAVAVSRARDLGVRSLVAPSAGNAGGALAAYGAGAGLEVTVVMPADVPAASRDEALVCGARVLLVEGSISDCGRVATTVAQLTGVFDVATLREPYRVEGKKTMGLELAEDLGWHLPDVIIYPTGGGTGLIGVCKAFDELERLGLIGSARPRMVAVQTEGCAPIVRAWRSRVQQAEPWADARTRAGGLRVPSPIGDALMLEALRGCGGIAVAVPEEQIDEAQRLAGRLGGGYVGPETAAALAAVAALRRSGTSSPTSRSWSSTPASGTKARPRLTCRSLRPSQTTRRPCGASCNSHKTGPHRCSAPRGEATRSTPFITLTITPITTAI
jgi:threonine synthase